MIPSLPSTPDEASLPSFPPDLTSGPDGSIRPIDEFAPEGEFTQGGNGGELEGKEGITHGN